ncbi:bMERB domain-containing protein 1-like isoform X2 [Melanotaenia boesemani]|uniref:bMERB domain-containing protein 1-like isoform X2 n=1 Tax=Melanotaenia boesemani TaxID=1250792 RepID=UPI001C04F22D|nr:bMERB domain-containing protein 1-like isoform X2 [Melanotaenia boesemani]
MEKKQGSSNQYGSLEHTEWSRDANKPDDDVVSMADSTMTVDDIEGELFKIERIRDVLVRRESELRYMMDDIQLCKEITRLKKELHKLVSIPDNDKSNEDRQKEEELLLQIHKLVETRDFLVDDVEFERLSSYHRAIFPWNSLFGSNHFHPGGSIDTKNAIILPLKLSSSSSTEGR